MKNRVFADGDFVTVTSTAIASHKSGDPVAVGGVTGVLTGDADATNKAVVCRKGIFDLSVKAINDSGNNAVAVGDDLYLVVADTPHLSKKSTAGVFFGWALEAITSGSTATINVLLHGGNTTVAATRLDAVEATLGSTSAAEMALSTDVSAYAVEYTVTAPAAIPDTVRVIELKHNTTAIEKTIASMVPYAGKFVVVKDTSASGTAAHKVTITTGTWDGTNKVVTLNAPGEFICVFVDSAGNGTVVANVGSVALS